LRANLALTSACRCLAIVTERAVDLPDRPHG
jgi:hypothetical protein